MSSLLPSQVASLLATVYNAGQESSHSTFAEAKGDTVILYKDDGTVYVFRLDPEASVLTPKNDD
jgi:hypothetical protein